LPEIRVLTLRAPYKDVIVANNVTDMATRMVESHPAPLERRLWLTLVTFVALGVLFTALNLHLPIARNALEYAKAALEISEHHFNLVAVVRDRGLSSGKPIFFALLAAPWVPFIGASAATLFASSVGTVFFLWMAAFTLVRLNRRSGLDPASVPLELALVALNPLVMYQFWSGYPDSLFAGLVLLAFNLTDCIAVSPERAGLSALSAHAWPNAHHFLEPAALKAGDSVRGIRGARGGSRDRRITYKSAAGPRRWRRFRQL
jgi:hypothetical protein